MDGSVAVLLPLLMCCCTFPAAGTPMPEPIVNVLDAGGVNSALTKLRALGGGTLFVPPGVWLCPPLNLTSDLTIYLAANATIKADPNADWPLVAPLEIYGQGHDHPGPRWQPFLGGWDVANLVIGGENGTIDGSGAHWWAQAPTEKYTRPSLFECVRCSNLVLEDVTFANSGFWTIHPVQSRGVTARRISVLNPNDSPNTDGFDPDATADVLLEDSYFATGDDAVAIKAGWDCAGYGSPGARPSTNITIRNITVWRGGGGVSLGSEMSGGIDGVLVEDCTLRHGSYGLQIKTGDTRGGFVRNVRFRNIRMEGYTKADVRIDAFYGFANPWCGDPTRVPPRVNNVSIQNVVALDTKNVSLHLAGLLDLPTTGISFTNVSFDRGVFECFGGCSGSATNVRPAPPAVCGLSTAA